MRGDLIVKDVPVEVELEGKVRGVGLRIESSNEQLVVDARGSFVWGPFTVEVTAAVTAVKEEA